MLIKIVMVLMGGQLIKLKQVEVLMTPHHIHKK
jgi:hypothetical protein